MDDFFSAFGAWHWLILGLGLMVVETFVPGAFFLWLGIAAIITGLVVGIAPLPWTMALVIWAVLSVVSVVGWIAFRRKFPRKAESLPLLNRRGEEFIGQTLILEKPVVNGSGTVRGGDTSWKVVCIQDLKAGAAVLVTAIEGTSLRVVPKDQENA